jgi:hypothetical protein
MSDKQRYRNGNVNAISMIPDTAAAIHVGDLVFRDPTSYKARPASGMANQGSEGNNQYEFHNLFAGVALKRGGALESGEVSFNLNPLPSQILVATTGDFEFDCAATAWQPGDLVGPANNTGGTALEGQTVKKVTTQARSIGVAVPSPTSIGQSKTTVIVRIMNTIIDGGEQASISGSSSGTP